MKNLIAIVFALIISVSSIAQLTTSTKAPVEKYKAPAPEFMGIEVDGSRADITSQFKSKGFIVSREKADENSIKFTGKINGMQIEVFAAFTTTSNKCWALMVYLPEQTNWYDIKRQYNEYLQILIDKYGKPNSSYDFFSSPYYEGDGYEMSALALGKCTYAAFWEKQYIQISKFKQVKIQYENPENSALDDKEKEKNNKKVF